MLAVSRKTRMEIPDISAQPGHQNGFSRRTGGCMKSSILAALVVSCLLAFAQGVRAQDAPKEHSMTGCLKSGDAPNTYMLTDLEKGPKMVGIVSSTAKLAPHVGHKVEITGTAVPAKDAEADANVPKAPHYMKVTAVKMISPTCP
jgi:hypothetical protein